MMKGKMDTYSTMINKNDGDDIEFSSELISNNSFLPFFSIEKTKDDSYYKENGIDIWDNSLSGGGLQNQIFDISKLERFIEM